MAIESCQGGPANGPAPWFLAGGCLGARLERRGSCLAIIKYPIESCDPMAGAIRMAGQEGFLMNDKKKLVVVLAHNANDDKSSVGSPAPVR
jgi:hypothetical protein